MRPHLNPIRTSKNYNKLIDELSRTVNTWRNSRNKSSPVEAAAVKQVSFAAFKVFKFIEHELEMWEMC
jgi:hypothetical protein